MNLDGNIVALSQVLEGKRRSLADIDLLILDLQRQREETRSECFDLEATILEGIMRAAAETGVVGLPTFIELDEIQSQQSLEANR